MATAQQILDDVNLRYRNSFTTEQKLVWFNEEQRELFDVLELDSPPYTFQTVEGENYYPFPDQFDTTKIKTVTYQINDTAEPSFVEVPFLRNDDRQGVLDQPWYTIVSDAIYLYVPDKVPDNRTVYIYTDSDPTEVTTANLNASPDLPTKYQEILKLGILKRICAARKDVVMVNNYTAEYEQKYLRYCGSGS
ncbi:hypothetical protein PACILC2_07280 [Paenibacillus cisolokensis]|uniref:Uncharacterized protein n=1 Tax=Paenibacillus cisolokensis TaxID=1658519 RepID=A0ABQ4N1V5_9BACL|nr:hypothetical protein [Paenibacillus cisolokensis]GIQ62160.1 hypothetical protein PACILC2_07280 [Paenibacillus cisolokensis]